MSVLCKNSNSIIKMLDCCFLRLNNHFLKLLCIRDFKQSQNVVGWEVPLKSYKSNPPALIRDTFHYTKSLKFNLTNPQPIWTSSRFSLFLPVMFPLHILNHSQKYFLNFKLMNFILLLVIKTSNSYCISILFCTHCQFHRIRKFPLSR